MFHKRIFLILIIILLLSALFVFIDRAERRKEVYDSLTAKFDLNDIEYGSKIHAADLVREHEGELVFESEVDTMKVGEQKIGYTLSGEEERYHQNVTKTEELILHVTDTKKPVITFEKESVNVYVGNDYDPKDNIREVYDEVDGDIQNYEISTDLDTSASGRYEVTVRATDINGLSSSASYQVSVRNRAVSGSEGYAIIYDILTGQYSYNRAAACGILANIRFESNFNPDVGDYYYGLCQWGGGRRDGLYSFCSSNGLDPSTIEGQLAFMNHELESSYSGVRSYLLSIEDSESGAYNAADTFCRNYEGAATAEGRGDLAVSYYIS